MTDAISPSLAHSLLLSLSLSHTHSFTLPLSPLSLTSPPPLSLSPPPHRAVTEMGGDVSEPDQEGEEDLGERGLQARQG